MPRKRREAPWLDKRANGVYYAFWYDAEKRRTRQCSLGTGDAAQAKTAFAQFLLNGRAIYEPDPDGVTVADALDAYLREHAFVKCADPKRQEDAAMPLREFFADTLVSDIDIPMSRQYAAARRRGQLGRPSKCRGDGRVSDSTIRRELTVLNAAANHAIRWKRMSAADAPSIELPAETSRETLWFTKDEMVALFDAAEGDLLRFVRIAYWTAARKEAVQGLTLSQIDFKNDRINFMPIGRVATKKRRPIVPIYDAIKPDLRWLIERMDGERLFGRRDFYRPFRQLCESLGMEGKAHPHVLRHSRATHLLQGGTSIYDVAKLLGDTVMTVERTYGHHSSEYLASTTGEM